MSYRPRRLLVEDGGARVRVAVRYKYSGLEFAARLTPERAVEVAKQLLELAHPLLQAKQKKQK